MTHAIIRGRSLFTLFAELLANLAQRMKREEVSILAARKETQECLQANFGTERVAISVTVAFEASVSDEACEG